MAEVTPTERHEQFRLDVLAVMRNYDDVSSLELMCVAAQLVGHFLAMQDQTRYTKPMLLETIARNVEIGNQTAIETWFGKTDGSA